MQALRRLHLGYHLFGNWKTVAGSRLSALVGDVLVDPDDSGVARHV